MVEIEQDFTMSQQQAMSIITKLTMWANGELHLRYNISSTYQVKSINSKKFNVKYVGMSAQVNFDTHSCTCWQFDLNHILYVHATVACWYYNISCYTMCSQYFTIKTLLFSYLKSIYPIGNEIDWIIFDHTHNKVVLPPKTRRPIGKPRKVRIPSSREGKHTLCYSWCGQYGHTKKNMQMTNPFKLL